MRNPDVRLLWAAKRHYVSDYSAKLHSHPEYHYMYATSGYGEIVIDSMSFDIGPHRLYTTNPRTPHQYRVRTGEPIQTIEVKFDVNDCEIATRLSGLPSAVIDQRGAIREHLETILFEANTPGWRRDEFVAMKFREFIYRLVRSSHQNPVARVDAVDWTHSARISHRLRRAAEYIKSHYAEAIDVRLLAEVACYHPSHFCRRFRSELGVSPMNYLIQIRIEQAKTLLEDTCLTVTQVGSSVGFRSLPYFSRCFSDRTGVSPSLYRRNLHARPYLHPVAGDG